MSNSDTPASPYYKQATDAADRGEFEYAKEICLNAVKQFQAAGEERNVSAAYHLLGTIAYRQRFFKDAELYYREALAIDQHTGDERGAARTCNNLSAVYNARGEYDAAEEWLWKSIHIKERLVDERGLAASYHQLGVVAEARLDFDVAEKWYLKSLDIAEKLNSKISVTKTCLNLGRVAEKRGDNDTAEKWRQKALQALGTNGDWSAAIDLGRQAERLEAAQIVYQKALDIAKEQKDDEGQSLSYLWLGYVACEMGDFEFAKDCYEKSIEIDTRIRATDRAAKSRLSLDNILLTLKQQRAGFDVEDAT